MQWSADRNAGFSRANPQKLFLPVIIDPEHHYETVNVEAQQQNTSSFLWWMKRLIGLRRTHPALGEGNIEFLLPDNRRILAFFRKWRNETILVVANLSRFVTYAEIDLSAHAGMVPVEMFGHTRFPTIGASPYFLTLGPHAFYWFKLEPAQIAETRVTATSAELPRLAVADSWHTALEEDRAQLERVLSAYLPMARWFGGKARQIRAVKAVDVIPVAGDDTDVYLSTWEVQFLGAGAEAYLLFLAFASGERAAEIRMRWPRAVVARLAVGTEEPLTEGVLYDALYDPAVCRFLLDALARRRRFRGETAVLAMRASKAFRSLRGDPATLPEPAVMEREQSNTSIIFGDRLVLKLYRRCTDGVSPDLQIGRFLTERARFAHTPPFAGHLEIRKGKSEPATVGILQGFVPNEGDAWQYTLDALGRFVHDVLPRGGDPGAAALPASPPALSTDLEVPPLARELFGSYLQSAGLMGQRTGELHAALSSDRKSPEFAPEPFTPHSRRALYQSMRTLADQSLGLLAKRVKSFDGALRASAERVLALEDVILGRFRAIAETRVNAVRIRCHGDYHLGQVLFTGKDFVIVDFEGEPARSVTERRIKRSPLTDVAGMLRSFDYATVSALEDQALEPEKASRLRPWMAYWRFWVSVGFLRSYLGVARGSTFLPQADTSLGAMLDLYLLEKAVYELGYELNNRPNWVGVPIEGILGLMERQA
jgi:maltose alpha-D-glucosyltransferase/alpha-amylase